MTQKIKDYLASQKWRPIERFKSAPQYKKRVRNLKGKEMVIEEWQKQWCIVRAKDGVEQLSYYIHDVGRWCYFTKETPPTHFRPILDDKLAQVCEVLLADATPETIEKAEQIIGGEL